MKSWIAWLLFAVICIYSVLDVYQTKLLFDLGACEANPLLRWLIEATGTWKVIVVVKWLSLTMMGVGIWMMGTGIRKMNDKMTHAVDRSSKESG